MTDGLRFAVGDIPATEQLQTLYAASGGAQADNPDGLREAVEHSQWVATAWHDDRLVGIARVLSDGVFVASLQDFMVHPDYRHQGIAKELLEMFDRAFGDYHQQFAMVEAEWARAKFEKRGFHLEPAAVSRIRPLSV